MVVRPERGSFGAPPEREFDALGHLVNGEEPSKRMRLPSDVSLKTLLRFMLPLRRLLLLLRSRTRTWSSRGGLEMGQGQRIMRRDRVSIRDAANGAASESVSECATED